MIGRMIRGRQLLSALILLVGGVTLHAQTVLSERFELQMEGDTLLYPALLPGTVQGTLMERGVLPHHFIESNEDSVQWVSDRNWLYTTHFEIDRDALDAHKGYLLKLGGVDTFAEVYINGALAGRCDNFFKTYQWEVKKLLRAGDNRLVIRLLSPTRIAHAHYLSNGFMYPADNDRAAVKYSPFVRTAPYHYGWDWGPRMITMGVMQPIELLPVDGPQLGEIYVKSDIEWEAPGKARRASVEVNYALREVVQGVDDANRLRVTLYHPDGRLAGTAEVGSPQCGVNYQSRFELERPELWMPNGWGEQPLYKVVREVQGEGYHQSDTTLVGVREIRLERKPDRYGDSFTFVVNNRPIYIKGANYLPHDRRFGGGGRTLQELFEEDIVPAHFNMLRLWGGGIYETEAFYTLADKYGILVWQDLPFACTTYPNDPIFRASVTREIEDQMSRIRNHPSIALVCGNNEVLEGLKHWGWQRSYNYSEEQYRQMFADYDSFFREMIPERLRAVIPHVDYIHGSPVSSNWGRPESFLSGDSHNWRVWFGGEDFTEFDRNPGRFSSEYGFQAFPEMKTIQSFAPDREIDTLTIYSPILKNRQRSFIGNQRITDYMERDYPVPDRFSDYIYVGQLLQGHGMAYAIRAVRRAYPVNMGTLYWQLNDVWPTVSWSSVDYWGNHKALHYYVKEAYAPYIIDVAEGQLWVASDAIADTPRQYVATVTCHNYEGDRLWEESYPFGVDRAPFSQKVSAAIPAVAEPSEVYMVLSLTDTSGELLARSLHYPVKPKEMALKPASPDYTVEAEEGCLRLTLRSHTLIKDLYIKTPWQGARYSNNFFDLLPGERYTVEIRHPDITDATSADRLRFNSLNRILQQYKP